MQNRNSQQRTIQNRKKRILDKFLTTSLPRVLRKRVRLVDFNSKKNGVNLNLKDFKNNNEIILKSIDFIKKKFEVFGGGASSVSVSAEGGSEALTKNVDININMIKKLVNSPAIKKCLQELMEKLDNLSSNVSSTPAKVTNALHDDEIIVDCEWEDREDKDSPAEEGKLEKRKNRRGQQARRLIWEKRYGEKAKHVIEAPLKKKEKKVVALQGPKPQIDTSLHPSWQAKKLLNSSAIRPSTGTRIVFEAEPKESEAQLPLKRVKSTNDMTSTHSKVRDDDFSTLHPSWQAKKLKAACILKSTGKKTLFTE